MATAKNQVCVISAEEFEGYDPLGLRQLIKEYFSGMFDRVRIVAYVRPHLQRIVSSYTEQTKIGLFSKDLESFFDLSAEKNRFLYEPRFQTWRNTFGEDFILRPFVHSALRDGSILTDFIVSALGPVEISADASDNHQNESLSLEDLLRVKFLHSSLKGRRRQFHHAYGWALAGLVAKLPQATSARRIRMHRSLAERVRRRYEADARKLDKDFFGEEPYMTQALGDGVRNACARPQPAFAEALFSESEIRSLTLAAQMIEELLENNAVPWPDYLRKRRHQELHGNSP